MPPFGQRTVGEVVAALLPNGCLGVAELTRDAFRERDGTITNAALSELNELRRWQRNNICALLRAFPRNLETARRVDAVDWSLPPASPFDVFAVAAQLLLKSGAHHHVEPERAFANGSSGAAPARILVVNENRRDKLEQCGDLWRGNPFFDPRTDPANTKRARKLFKSWRQILAAWSEPVYRQSPQADPPPKWWKAALSLLIVSDTAAKHAGLHVYREPPKGESSTGPFQDDESNEDFWRWLAAINLAANAGTTISSADRDIVCVLPKSRTAQIGCTLRSLSHNLALLPPVGLVRAKWVCTNGLSDWRDPKQDQRIFEFPQPPRRENDPFNLLVIPYPYEVSARDFRPSSDNIVRTANWSDFDAFPMRHGEHGALSSLISFVVSLIANARADVGPINGIVFPELALSARAFRDLDERLFRRAGDIDFFCAGLFQRPRADQQGGSAPESFPPESGNFCAVAAYYGDDDAKNGAGEPKKPFTAVHRKHHRWKLESRQITDYALGASLDPARIWWENSRTLSRSIPIIAMRQGWTVTSLICEDLARMDPAQEVVRATGPNLVIALLMDGAQLGSRWPARYATVLADDPGSAVLTITSMGLISRTNSTGRYPPSRSIGLWKGGASSPTQSLDLPEGTHALCLTLTKRRQVEFTLDGRKDDDDCWELNLTGVRPVRSDLPPPPWGA